MDTHTLASHDRSILQRGVFIALDGPDGGGKTSQLVRLAEWLRLEGMDPLICRDPGGTVLGDQIRALLLTHNDQMPVSMTSEMLLYMAIRAQLVHELIQPALTQGRLVVSDRFLLANVVYQGYAGGLPIDDLWKIGGVATGGLLPDLTLVLDVPPQVAAARIGQPRDRLEARGLDYHTRVRSGFLHALKTYPAPFCLVDASVDPDVVAAKIRTEVSNALGLRSGA